MDIDYYLWQLQMQMMDNMPDDFAGNQAEWEINVIYWILKARRAIKDGTMSINTVNFVAQKLIQK